MFNKTIWGTRLMDWDINENAVTKRFKGPDNRLKYEGAYTYGKNHAYILTNSREGYGSTYNLTVKAEPIRNLRITASYTSTESKEISGMPGSAANSAYQGLASVNGPNFLTLQRSQYVVPDKVSADISYYIDLIGGLQLDLYYTGYSAYGNSFTYSTDMNGDGLATDLIYIPATKDEVAFTSEADRDAFWKFVEQDKYLSTHEGQYAEVHPIFSYL